MTQEHHRPSLQAEVSANIIDQCVAQGVPFARDYGGLLDNRSFGGVLVSRTFYAKGQTGQQLLLGAYSAMNRQIAKGKIAMYNRHEMLDVVLVDGKARGIIARNLVTGEIERHSAHAVIIATGGYGNVFYLSTNAMGSNVTASWKIHKKGAYFANPCYTQIHPTCIPMAFAVAGLRSAEGIEISNCANVATSFPNFVELANLSGMRVSQS